MIVSIKLVMHNWLWRIKRRRSNRFPCISSRYWLHTFIRENVSRAVNVEDRGDYTMKILRESNIVPKLMGFDWLWYNILIPSLKRKHGDYECGICNKITKACRPNSFVKISASENEYQHGEWQYYLTWSYHIQNSILSMFCLFMEDQVRCDVDGRFPVT